MRFNKIDIIMATAVCIGFICLVIFSVQAIHEHNEFMKCGDKSLTYKELVGKDFQWKGNIVHISNLNYGDNGTYTVSIPNNTDPYIVLVPVNDIVAAYKATIIESN